jgi:hypothetical protein
MERAVMTNRAVIVVSTLFGVFTLLLGILGARAITVGPETSSADATALAQRTAAANALERRIRLVAGRTPPQLPSVPTGSTRAPGAAAVGRSAVATPIAVSVRATPQVKSGPSPGGATARGETEREAGDHGDD